MFKLFNNYTQFFRNSYEMLALLVAIKRSIPVLLKSWFEAINILELKRKSIRNQTILITGAGNELGRDLAVEFAKYENKCNIVVADLDLTAANDVALYLKTNFNVNAYAYYVDVCDYNSVNSLYQKVVNDVDYVDILVNNASLVSSVSLREKEWPHVERVLKVNLHSHLLTTRIFIEDMIRRKSGHIVGISSIAGYFSYPNMITYCASKHGVTGFMKCLSYEMFTEGHSDYIKTTLVYPYFTKPRRVLSNSTDLPMAPYNSSDVANTIVNGVLKDRDEIYVPKLLGLMNILTLVPFRVFHHIIQYFHKRKTNYFEESHERINCG